MQLHSILIVLDLLITIRDNLTCLQRKLTSWAQRDTTLHCDGAWWGPLTALPWIPPPHARALPGSTNFVGTNAQAHLLVMSLIYSLFLVFHVQCHCKFTLQNQYKQLNHLIITVHLCCFGQKRHTLKHVH